MKVMSRLIAYVVIAVGSIVVYELGTRVTSINKPYGYLITLLIAGLIWFGILHIAEAIVEEQDGC